MKKRSLFYAIFLVLVLRSAQRSVHEKKNPYQCKVCGASFEIVTRVSSWDYTVDHIWYLNDAVYRWSFLG